MQPAIALAQWQGLMNFRQEAASAGEEIRRDTSTTGLNRSHDHLIFCKVCLLVSMTIPSVQWHILAMLFPWETSHDRGSSWWSAMRPEHWQSLIRLHPAVPSAAPSFNLLTIAQKMLKHSMMVHWCNYVLPFCIFRKCTVVYPPAFLEKLVPDKPPVVGLQLASQLPVSWKLQWQTLPECRTTEARLLGEAGAVSWLHKRP